jgi:hypothetical protein
LLEFMNFILRKNFVVNISSQRPGKKKKTFFSASPNTAHGTTVQTVETNA